MIALLLVALLGDVQAAARLAEIRARFSSDGREQSTRALEQLAREARATEAGGQAAAWLGALAQQGGDLDGAALWYEYAQAAPAGGEARRLSLRGLGNVDLARHRYPEAQAKFSAAQAGASGVLAEELSQKQRLAAHLLAWQRAEWLAWVLVTAAFGYFLLRAWRGQGPLQPPLEVIYVLPVYALLVAGGAGRDPAVLRALVLGGAISIVLIATAGLATRRAPPRSGQRWWQAALLLLANLALFVAVLNRLGLIDTVIMTAQM